MAQRSMPMNHAERDAYCKPDFWFEPGSKNYRGEFFWWLHIESELPSYFIAPWPFAEACLGNTSGGDQLLARAAPLLEAHYHIHGFQQWPGSWFDLSHHLSEARKIGSPYPTFWWGLFRTPRRSQLLHNPDCAISQEFINALTRSRKAGRQPV